MINLRIVRGLVPPLITPLKQDGSIDEYAMHLLFDRVLGPDADLIVDGVFILGLTGEFPWLTTDQKMAMIDASYKARHKRVPILIGATGESKEETIGLCRYSQDKADGIVIAPTYFHSQIHELPHVVHEIAGLFPDMPFYIYFNRELSANKRDFGDDVYHLMFENILVRNPNVVGVKASVDEPGLLQEYVIASKKASRVRPDKLEAVVMSGNEKYMTYTEGCVPSFANIDSGLCRRVMQADNKDEGEELQKKVIEAGDIIYSRERGVQPKIIGGLKFALMRLGIGNGKCIAPDQELSQEEQQRITNYVVENYVHPW